MKRRLFIALVMLVLSRSVPALAVPFLYDESVSGDLTCQNPPCATTFPFDIGTNIIKGTVSNGAANTDSFSFSIPAGAVLTSVTYSWTVSGIPTVTLADFRSVPLTNTR